MNIYTASDQYITIYSINSDGSILRSRERSQTSKTEAYTHIAKKMAHGDICLMPEEEIITHHITLEIDARTPLKRSDYQQRIAHHTQECDNMYNRQTYKRHTYTQAKNIDGYPTAHIIGETGHIACEICFWGAKKTLFSQASLGSIYPQHIQLIQKDFFGDIRNHVILVMNQYSTKAIHVRKNRYTHIHTLNLGRNYLIQLLQEAGITEEIYSNTDISQTSGTNNAIIRKSINHFCDPILGRLKSQENTDGNGLFVSDIPTHHSLTPYIIAQFKNIIGGYLATDHNPNIESQKKQPHEEIAIQNFLDRYRSSQR